MPLYIPRKLWFSTRSGEIRSKFSPAALKIGIISKYFGWECDQNPRLRACVILANFHFCVVSFVWTGSKYISEEAGAVFHDILCYGHPTFCLGVATFYWMSIFDFSAFRGILTGFLNLKTLKTQLHSHLISSFFTTHFINFWPSNNMNNSKLSRSRLWCSLGLYTIPFGPMHGQSQFVRAWVIPELLLFRHHINFNWRAKCEGGGKIGSKNGLVTRYGIYERALTIMLGGRREFPQWAFWECRSLQMHISHTFSVLCHPPLRGWAGQHVSHPLNFWVWEGANDPQNKTIKYTCVYVCLGGGGEVPNASIF